MKVTQHTIDALDGILEERLEIDIIAQLADRLGIDMAHAMELYYSSKLAEQVSEGAYGIQFLDASVLVDDLIENELNA